MQRSSQLCLLLSVEQLLTVANMLQFPLNMCRHGVCFLNLTEPYTNQMYGSDYGYEPLETHLP